MTIQQRVLWVFFLQPIALGAWVPRIPEIQTKLGLDAGGLAIALLGSPIGTLITLTFAGRLVHAIGSKRTLMILYPTFFITMLLPLVAPNLLTIFIALALVGSAMSVLELGLNVTADEVEKREKRIIMSKAHGFWSLGLMTGTALGSLAAGIHLPPIWAGIIIAVIVLPLSIILCRKLPDHVAPEEVEAPGAKGFSWPHPILLGICLFVFGTSLTEGAVADWSAIYMRDIFETSAGIGGIAVTAFSLSVALARLTGDHFKQRFGPARLGRALALVGLLGVLVIVFAQHPVIAIGGFVLIGIGAAVGFPLAVTAAVSAPGRNAASNVAMLSFAALSGFLVGPIVIGAVTHHTDIRIGLGFLLPMLALSALLAPMLVKRTKAS